MHLLFRDSSVLEGPSSLKSSRKNNDISGPGSDRYSDERYELDKCLISIVSESLPLGSIGCKDEIDGILSADGENESSSKERSVLARM